MFTVLIRLLLENDQLRAILSSHDWDTFGWGEQGTSATDKDGFVSCSLLSLISS